MLLHIDTLISYYTNPTHPNYIYPISSADGIQDIVELDHIYALPSNVQYM